MAPNVNRIDVRPGDRVQVELPFSEVCCHMRVAGKVMVVEITTARYPMAQLIREDGSPFSFPITLGEAGIYGPALDGSLYAYVVVAS